MDALHLRERPALQHPVVIAAFSGWPDAAEVSSTAIRYLIERLDAVKIGEIDPEFFFDLSEQRPTIGRSRRNPRLIRWPTGNLYARRSPEGDQDFLLFSSPEPHLRWLTYCELLTDLAKSYEARLFITLGGTYDAVSHRGAAKMTGWSNSADWTQQLRDLGISSVIYEGPTAIHSALLDACDAAHLTALTLWGHAPQYVRSTPNTKVCHAALDGLRRLLGLNLNLDRLRGAALALDQRVNELVRNDPKLAAYVQSLEASHEVLPERTDPEPAELPDSQTIVRELEEFLRGSSGESGPDRNDDQ